MTRPGSSIPLPAPRLRGQFLRYLLVGGGAAVIDFGGFLALIAAGLAVAPAAVASFGLAAAFNFALSARYVFGLRASVGRFVVFLGFALVGLAINASVTVAVAGMLTGALAGAGAAALAPGLGKLVGIGAAFLFNFAANAFVVFRRDRAAPRPRAQNPTPAPEGGAREAGSGRRDAVTTPPDLL